MKRVDLAQHQILVTAQQTMFVVVDHQLDFEKCFNKGDVHAAHMGIANLMEASDQLSVPMVASFVKTNEISSQLGVILDNSIPETNRQYRICTNPWDDNAFETAIVSSDRSCLLVAGLSVESSLSFTALCALERGFDVYVIEDACLGFSKQSSCIAFNRLQQAGVIVLSWRQVLLEWNQGAVDTRLLRRVMEPTNL